jgi:methyltransferase family protein
MDRQNFLKEDTYALQVMQHLLDGPYLPFTNSALRPLCLAYILNDIVVNSRKTILEFGSGISTIMMSRLIKLNNTGTRIVSVEHDRGWADVVQAYIRREGLEKIASVLHAPLTHCPVAVGSNLWYELDANSGIFKNAFFDMVVVDGPPAYEMSKEMSRYPALPFIYEKLADKCSVFLDDADRWGEKEIISRWEKEYAIRLQIIDDSFAYTLRGDNFNLKLF